MFLNCTVNAYAMIRAARIKKIVIIIDIPLSTNKILDNFPAMYNINTQFIISCMSQMTFCFKKIASHPIGQITVYPIGLNSSTLQRKSQKGSVKNLV